MTVALLREWTVQKSLIVDPTLALVRGKLVLPTKFGLLFCLPNLALNFVFAAQMAWLGFFLYKFFLPPYEPFFKVRPT